MFRIRCKKRAAGLVGIIFDRVTTFSLMERQITICRTDGIRFRRAESSKKVLIILKNRIIENKNVEKTP